VFFNGQLAGRYAPRFAAEGYDVDVLPSTSPAFAAMPAAERVLRWTRAIGPWMQAGPAAPFSR
jgi:G:T/U-mismatch repair DNA glycosylase